MMRTQTAPLEKRSYQMTKETKDLIHRRALLVRLGLAAGTAYVAPTLAGMDVARASTGSGGGSGGGSGSRSGGSRGSRSGGQSGPSGASGPSRPDRGTQSRASGPSRGSSKSRSGNWRWQWDGDAMRWVRAPVDR